MSDSLDIDFDNAVTGVGAPGSSKGSLRTIVVVIAVVFLIVGLAVYVQIDGASSDDDTEASASDLDGVTGLNRFEVSPGRTAPILEDRVATPTSAPSEDSAEVDNSAREAYEAALIDIYKAAVANEVLARRSPLVSQLSNQSNQSPTNIPVSNNSSSSNIGTTIVNGANSSPSIDRLNNLDSELAALDSRSNSIGRANGSDEFPSNSPANPSDPARAELQGLSEYPEVPISLVSLGRYVVNAGTIIRATADQGINSDTSGFARALIQNDVFDSSGQFVVIPRGSHALGRYATGANFGDERVAIVWNRIEFPNGRTADIGSNVGTDSLGQAGVKDRVNNKYGKLFGQILLLSTFQAAASVSSDDRSNEFGDELERSVRVNNAQVGETITRRNLAVSPTLRIRVGKALTIQVAGDLIFEDFYHD